VDLRRRVDDDDRYASVDGLLDRRHERACCPSGASTMAETPAADEILDDLDLLLPVVL
jgi:hypothetical protein